MSEIFKSRPQIEDEPEVEVVAEAPERAVDAQKHEDAVPNEEHERLDVYEHEKGYRISEDYFNSRQLMSDDFNVRMSVYSVDKFVKEVMERKQLDNTVTNFKRTLSEIEDEIGTKNLDIFARLKKLVGYTKIMGRLNKLKEDRKKYLSF